MKQKIVQIKKMNLYSKENNGKKKVKQKIKKFDIINLIIMINKSQNNEYKLLLNSL